jgi:hypothetical protein
MRPEVEPYERTILASIIEVDAPPDARLEV